MGRNVHVLRTADVMMETRIPNPYTPNQVFRKPGDLLSFKESRLKAESGVNFKEQKYKVQIGFKVK